MSYNKLLPRKANILQVPQTFPVLYKLNISIFFSLWCQLELWQRQEGKTQTPTNSTSKACFKSAVKVANIKPADCCNSMINATNNNQHVLSHNHNLLTQLRHADSLNYSTCPKLNASICFYSFCNLTAKTLILNRWVPDKYCATYLNLLGIWCKWLLDFTSQKLISEAKDKQKHQDYLT